MRCLTTILTAALLCGSTLPGLAQAAGPPPQAKAYREFLSSRRHAHLHAACARANTADGKENRVEVRFRVHECALREWLDTWNTASPSDAQYANAAPHLDQMRDLLVLQHARDLERGKLSRRTLLLASRYLEVALRVLTTVESRADNPFLALLKSYVLGVEKLLPTGVEPPDERAGERRETLRSWARDVDRECAGRYHDAARCAHLGLGVFFANTYNVTDNDVHFRSAAAHLKEAHRLAAGAPDGRIEAAYRLVKLGFAADVRGTPALQREGLEMARDYALDVASHLPTTDERGRQAETAHLYASVMDSLIDLLVGANDATALRALAWEEVRRGEDFPKKPELLHWAAKASRDQGDLDGAVALQLAAVDVAAGQEPVAEPWSARVQCVAYEAAFYLQRRGTTQDIIDASALISQYSPSGQSCGDAAQAVAQAGTP